MNLPNKLTVSRLLLAMLFVIVVFSELPFRETVALGLFIIASLTDYFDGKIARRDKLITNFGILLDPLADKILVCSAFIAFVGLDLIPAWMVVLIVARELTITGLRLLAASKHVVLAAERYGKHKTASQVTSIIATLVLMSYPQWGLFGKLFSFWFFGEPWVAGFTRLSQWVAVLLTIISGSLYLWRNRDIYIRDV